MTTLGCTVTSRMGCNQDAASSKPPRPPLQLLRSLPDSILDHLLEILDLEDSYNLTAAMDDPHIFELLLQRWGEDPELLRFGVHCNHIVVVKEVVKRFGVDIFDKHGFRRFALLYVFEHGLKEMTHYLLTLKLHHCSPYNAYASLFHWAATNATPAVIHLLARAGYNVIRRKDSQGREPIHLAAAMERWDNLRCLVLKAKADIDAPDAGLTLLQQAYGREKTHGARHFIKECICLGSNVNVTVPKSRSGVDSYASSSIDTMPLHLAVHQGDLELGELLIYHGADVNAPDPQGQTPLFFIIHAAQRANHIKVDSLTLADRLVKAGAKLAVKDATGNTPLHVAVLHHNTNIAELLLKNGADVNAWNDEGLTPMMFLGQQALSNATKGDRGDKENARIDVKVDGSHVLRMWKLLLQRGADVHAESRDTKQTALFYCSNREHQELLLGHGARIEHRNIERKTAAECVPPGKQHMANFLNRKMQGRGIIWKADLVKRYY